MLRKAHSLVFSSFGLLFSLVSTAHAAPTLVSVTPPNNARFLVNQRFDLRVEGKGAGPFSATIAIDGVPQTFTSGAQNTLTSDGISWAGFGGFNLRGYSSCEAGTHRIRATFTDSTGTVTVESRFEVQAPFGGREGVKNIIIMLGDGMGAAHRTAARLVRYGVSAGDPNGYLAMDSFPATGMVTTHSSTTITRRINPCSTT